MNEPTIVGVVHRGLDRPMPEPNPARKLYHYRWTLNIAPEIGMRVVVPEGDGQSTAIVVVLNPETKFPVERMKVVTRVI